jgi:hypothetical protein
MRYTLAGDMVRSVSRDSDIVPMDIKSDTIINPLQVWNDYQNSKKIIVILSIALSIAGISIIFTKKKART